MRIFVTGATGLIGRRLVAARLARGDEVTALSRSAGRARKTLGDHESLSVVEGDAAESGSWTEAIDGCDAVVHLAGAGLADRRWTAKYKAEIRSSRVDSTALIARTIADAARPPKVWVNGSAIGYYGDTGDQTVTEATSSGHDFLAELCVDWERAAAGAPGVRTVLLRTGVVLDAEGGALPEMMRPLKLFVGGPMGSGRQYVSWIHHRDLVGLIEFALDDARVSGPLNGTAPYPVRNRMLMHELGRALHRPSWLRAPGFALRIVIGEFAQALLASQRVAPAAAQRLGYHFQFETLEPALKQLLHGEEEDDDGPGERAPRVRSARGGGRGRGLKYRLLAVDIDGTLLNRAGELPDEVAAACRKASDAGCAVVLSTARSPRTAASVYEALSLDTPMINFNGAMIWRPWSGGAAYHAALDPATAREVIEVARAASPDLVLGVDILDRWYADQVDLRFQTESGPLIEPDDVGPIEDFLESGPITRLSIFGLPHFTRALAPLVRDQFWRARRIGLFEEPMLLQVTHPLVDKGIALQRVARALGVEQEAVLAIGDGRNDLGMLEWAGFGVAVANACEEAQRLANVVAPSSDALGVAEVIQQYVLRRR